MNLTDFKKNPCSPPHTYFFTIIDFWITTVSDIAHRLTTWLAFLMAFLRFVILRNYLNPKFEKFSKPIFALKIMISGFIVSTLMSLFYFGRFRFEEKEWVPPKRCNITASFVEYQRVIRYDFLEFDAPLMRVFNITDGLLKLIPTCLFPVLTFLLIKQLREAESSRNRVRKQEDPKKDHTTKLVIMMTITFIAAEGPFGIVYFFQGVVINPPGLGDIARDLMELIEFFVVINAASHCFVCLVMSSEYRKAVKEIFFFFVNCLSILVNTFHVFVLTRKSMRISSVNILMVGIALCDLYVMAYTAWDMYTFIFYDDYDWECTPPSHFYIRIGILVLSAILEILRRLSAWLSLLMAFVRYLAIKNALNSKFDFLSEPIFGVKLMLVSFLLSALATLFFYGNVRLKKTIVPWTPSEICEGFPVDFSVPDYMQTVESFLFLDGMEVQRVAEFINGVLKFVPTLIFPVVTFLLVQKLRSANKLRRKTSASKGNNKKTDQTTYLVIFIAITYMIGEGPYAIITAIRALNVGPSILWGILTILSPLIGLNTITHLFICLAISSQYQKAVKDIFNCRGKRVSLENPNHKVERLFYSKQESSVSQWLDPFKIEEFVTQAQEEMDDTDIYSIPDDIYYLLIKIQILVDCISVIVNVFHVFILLKKSMRTNCANILMAGIGLCDLYVVGYTAYRMIELFSYDDYDYECTPPSPLYLQILTILLVAISETLRRLSAWFSLLMAFVRFLAIKNALNSKYDFLSEPLFGVKIMIVSFLLSALVTGFFYRGVRFKAAMVEWTPSESCEGFPPGYSVPDYMPFIQKVAFLDGIQVMRLFEFIDGSLKVRERRVRDSDASNVQIIPTMVFPILTFLLVQNLRNANKLRRKASTRKGGEDNSKTDQTTKLVILIAITYITAEGPWAIVTMIRSLDSGP
ncbi:hypothetical protein CAEBREN_24426 [Caenorhabditis brenneri]|uniref:G-protein coupled receptors family 1 profile domain-containing protein n=1 Tax=Caenorhabditis brenneri TaxID=135651 RepID=G0M9X5_CAEBE|nr:hypothetical protein CAEBREN_24426 [Caenorhabditis brenneri]